MSYSAHHIATSNVGLIHIKLPRLCQPQDGLESSAAGPTTPSPPPPPAHQQQLLDLIRALARDAARADHAADRAARR
jgi:hypothetical protein